MDRLCIGMLFVLFDLNLNLFGVRVPLLPDCIGYLLLLGGFMQLQGESDVFLRVRPLAGALAAYRFFTLIGTLTGLVSDPFLTYALNAVGAIGLIVTAFQLIRGFQELEARRQIELYSPRLKKCWALMVSFQVFSLLTIAALLLSFLCSIISFLISIFFLFTMNMARINWKNGIAGAESPDAL